MKIGWIGVGKMGLPMVRHLAAAGHEVTAFDVDPAGPREAARAGVRTAGSVAGAACGAEAAFSSIPDDAAFRAVALGDGGVLAALAPGAVHVDMSTVSPAVSEEAAKAAEERGVSYLRAPVSGSVTLAEAGTLTVIVSGPEDALERCRPLFELLGSGTFHVGAGEQARYLKLAINNMVHATAVAMAESLALGRKGGLEWGRMLEVFATSAVASPLVRYKSGPLGDRDFSPMSFVATAVKDQELFNAAAEAAGVRLDVAPAIAEVFREMLESEDRDKDFFATVLRAERRAGLGDPRDAVAEAERKAG